MITTEMRRLIEHNTIGLVATITPDGRPAVSPKATTAVLDERRVAFSNLRSPGTIANITANPAVELNYIDVFQRKACRLSGTARYLPREAPAIEPLLPHFSKWGNLIDRMRGIVVVEVDRAQMIKSPAYDTGATEAELDRQWLIYYTDLLGRR